MEEDPWSVRKTSFQKSRSVDVAMDGSGAAASRFADYTTTASAAKETKAEEDIPDWKRRMLERQKKDQEKKEEEEAKQRNFGFVPGTTLHSSYVNKSYDTDSRLSSWGSASNLRASSYSNLAEADDDSSYRRTKESSTESSRASVSRTSRASVEKAPAEMTPYEKYLQRKREQEKKDEEESNRKEEAKREEERRKEREKRREEERKREEDIEKERQRKREKEREERRLEEERKRKEEEEKEKRKREERKRIEEETKAKAAQTNTWGRSGTRTTPEPETPKAKPRWGAAAAAKKEEEAPAPKPTPKWGVASSAAKPAADEAVPKKKPWEKPSAAAKSTLPSLGEVGPAKKSTPGAASTTTTPTPRKTSESDSEASVSISSKVGGIIRFDTEPVSPLTQLQALPIHRCNMNMSTTFTYWEFDFLKDKIFYDVLDFGMVAIYPPSFCKRYFLSNILAVKYERGPVEKSAVEQFRVSGHRPDWPSDVFSPIRRLNPRLADGFPGSH